MNRRSFIALFLIITTLVPVNAQFGPIGDIVGKVVTTAVKTVTAPTQTILNTAGTVIGVSKSSDIYAPMQDVIKSSGQTVNAVTQTFLIDPPSFLHQKARNFAGIAGTPGKFIFDVSTFTDKTYRDLIGSGASNVGKTLQTQNPFQISAAPLAAAIRSAKDVHATEAKPIPADVRAALHGYFNESTLARAKYTVGSIEITLPNFIGQGKKLFGEDVAVVVDDIIVFPTDPGSFAKNPCSWVHEMTHVQQYEQLGIDLFAYQYMLHSEQTEMDADANARRVTRLNCKTRLSLPKISFDMSGAKDNVDYKENPEIYIAQSVFFDDSRPVNYLITNYGRIIAVNPIKGDWSHIGYAIPSNTPGVAWEYKTQKERYNVSVDGNIYSQSTASLNNINLSPSIYTFNSFIKLGSLGGKQVGVVRSLRLVSASYMPSDPTNTWFNSPSNSSNLTVVRTYIGSHYRFKVNLKLPNSGFLPGQQFNQITVYGFLLSPNGRFDLPANLFPSLITGNWKPGEQVDFEMNLPNQIIDPAEGYYVVFCVGSPAGCLPSPNLLRGAPK